MHVTRRAVLAGLALPGLAAAAKPAGPVSFAAQDGVPVTGRLYGRGPRGVVLVPGGHGVGETWHIQAERLARAGFHVLAVDYRGRGRAGGIAPDDEKAHLDVIGAARHLRARGARSIALVGASWGGWAAGTAAIAAPGLAERIVLLAHSPFDHPERLGGRKLFILGRDDRVGSGKLRLEDVQKQYDRAPAPKQLVLLDGAAHAQFLFLTDQGPRLGREILRFLSAA
ncbi:MAG TPA: alpha/beta fold hydrolase [Allosphingosinicella sp.]|jgi:dienelactone hydrolase